MGQPVDIAANDRCPPLPSSALLKVSHIKPLYHPMLLHPVPQGKPLSLDRRLEDIQPAVEHDLPACIRDNIAGVRRSCAIICPGEIDPGPGAGGGD